MDQIVGNAVSLNNELHIKTEVEKLFGSDPDDQELPIASSALHAFLTHLEIF